ncbi:hypothetical protein GCM10010174_14410 [Kutzneria viridogrisea]|uniref:Uncharacterized protein n=2 Tax=Kutzneria TaxID=43356 RepID=W5WIB4_9PSEU|nr:hypothetical protein [Kutzneria albida]AHI00934.1 hypothetical protein KALB_7576 [Kutzneria albida DSM 43870]MBA8926211.1 hypothetical protein [Kutzneria viridogrisea]
MSEQGNKSAGLFDLRYILALLFGVYGLVLTVMGLWFTKPEGLEKAGGVNINLWGGIVMLLAGIAFTAWARLRPIVLPDAGDATGAGEG